MDSKLSYDLNIEILSRASLKSLNVMRCTSMEYNNLTYDSHLVEKHKQRNNIVSGVIIQHDGHSKHPILEFVPSHKSDSLDLGFIPKDARILSSSNQGIVLLETPHKWYLKVLYYVCKPATKQLLELPDPCANYRTNLVGIIVMGSDPLLHYKIVRFFLPDISIQIKRQTTYNCDIFDSKAFTWTLLKPVHLPYGVLLSDPFIICRGSAYSLMSNCDILKFDANSETWKTLSSPNQIYNTRAYTCRKLVKYEGKLGLACKQTNGFWEIWIYTIDESWEQTYILNEKDYIRGMSLEAFYDSNTSVMLDHDTLIFHSFKGNTANDTNKKVTLGHPPYATFSFQSDYEPVDLEGTIKMPLRNHYNKTGLLGPLHGTLFT